MKQLSTFLLLTFSLAICSKGNTHDIDRTDQKKGLILLMDSNKVIQDTILVINNKITHNPFEFQYFSISIWEMKTRLIPLNYSVKKLLTPADYDTSIIDTTFKFNNGKSTITYHNLNCGFITNAVIMDNSIKLSDNIKIGDSYNFVLNKLAPERLNKVNSNQIIIQNDDGARISIILTFKNGKLISFVFIPYTG